MKLNFQDLTLQDFLENYWQKRPVLLKNGFLDFDCPISGDELAGLSMEEDACSRLITCGDKYTLKHGPFTESDFEEVSESTYCLLVQETETFIPEIAKLKHQFRFIPDWRMDDVMVSYATDGGTVGAHVDFFDVFLIQGDGKRKWEIGKQLSSEPEYEPDMPVRLMKNFEIDQTFILEKGDILYLPPNVPHNGVAIGESITISMGFRTASHAEIAKDFSEYLGKALAESRRLDEPLGGYDAKFPGLISKEVICEVRKVIDSFPKDDESISHWFGKLVTKPIRGEQTSELTDVLSSSEFEDFEPIVNQAFSETQFLLWNESVRLSYFVLDKSIKIFVDGEVFEMDKDMLKDLENLVLNKGISKDDYDNSSSDSFKFLAGALIDLNILYSEGS